MKRILRSQFVLTAIALILLGVGPSIALVGHQTAQATSGDWSGYLFDSTHSGFNPAETIINNQTAPHLKVHWTRTNPGHIFAEPVEANGMLYWASWNGIEHASRLSDGTDVW